MNFGIYHKKTGNLIAFPFPDDEEGYNEAEAMLKDLHIPLDSVLFDKYIPGQINILNNKNRTTK